MARELIISAFRQIAAAYGVVMAADKLGKYKTISHDIAVGVLLFAPEFPGVFGLILRWLGVGIFAIATILTVWSGIAYVVNNKQVLKDA
jgi:CDP-diacylglycerol--glycerol-3-phosphate 3-phosphatidyltransferase